CQSSWSQNDGASESRETVLPSRDTYARTPSPPVLRIGHDWFQIQQNLVEARLEHPGDRVFRLTGVIAKRATRAELPDTQIAIGARDDLVCPPATTLAREILVAFVRRTGQPAFEKDRIRAATPGALARFITPVGFLARLG